VTLNTSNSADWAHVMHAGATMWLNGGRADAPPNPVSGRAEDVLELNDFFNASNASRPLR
jgi:hypothetical protein